MQQKVDMWADLWARSKRRMGISPPPAPWWCLGIPFIRSWWWRRLP